MKAERYILLSLALIAIQAGLLNFLDLSQFITVLFAPAIILCLPLAMPTSIALVISFAVGFLIDFCSHGVLGLTVCALLPVALLRKPVVGLVCGKEVFSRGEDISFGRQGLLKVSVTLSILTAIFLLIYIIADGAGTRPFWFNTVRFFLSMVADTLVGLVVVDILSERR